MITPNKSSSSSYKPPQSLSLSARLLSNTVKPAHQLALVANFGDGFESFQTVRYLLCFFPSGLPLHEPNSKHHESTPDASPSFRRGHSTNQQHPKYQISSQDLTHATPRKLGA